MQLDLGLLPLQCNYVMAGVLLITEESNVRCSFVWLSLLSNASISSTADQPLGPLWTGIALAYIFGAARHFPGADRMLCSHLLELEAKHSLPVGILLWKSVSVVFLLSEINHKEPAADTSQYVQVKVDSPGVKVAVGFVFLSSWCAYY